MDVGNQLCKLTSLFSESEKKKNDDNNDDELEIGRSSLRIAVNVIMMVSN